MTVLFWTFHKLTPIFSRLHRGNPIGCKSFQTRSYFRYLIWYSAPAQLNLSSISLVRKSTQHFKKNIRSTQVCLLHPIFLVVQTQTGRPIRPMLCGSPWYSTVWSGLFCYMILYGLKLTGLLYEGTYASLLMSTSYGAWWIERLIHLISIIVTE